MLRLILFLHAIIAQADEAQALKMATTISMDNTDAMCVSGRIKAVSICHMGVEFIEFFQRVHSINNEPVLWCPLECLKVKILLLSELVDPKVYQWSSA